MTAFLSGFTLGLGLIVAIGAQNAFVLRQGLKREHVFAVSLVCALSDALLIAAGVSGFGLIVDRFPWLIEAMRYGGAAFLIVYGIRSLPAAFHSTRTLQAAAGSAGSLRTALLTCLALTWLNPHVYLDTVVLLGSVSTQFGDDRPLFAAGAMLASFGFFFALGYGARLLRPLFASVTAWRLLDGVTALVMFAIAAKLLFEV
ncbi:MAG: amino acid transporter [Alphaproteobacteria bacterium]|nr:MAG: amino acid transporter [Alphaproteobacteria bacterium]